MKTHSTCINRRLARSGFTIIELMVVLLLIGVLMGIAAINLPGVLNRGKERATRASQQVIASALQEYKLSNSGYPANNSLQVLVEREYLTRASDLNDSWDVPMAFLAPSQVNGMDVEYTLTSAGKDNIFGTPDDIIYYPGMDN